MPSTAIHLKLYILNSTNVLVVSREKGFVYTLFWDRAYINDSVYPSYNNDMAINKTFIQNT